jgi:hypothetical protein
VYNNAAMREFYSFLRATVKSASMVGHVSFLINDQTILKNMSKIPHTVWKEWATHRPDLIPENVEDAFKRFVEQKWKDAISMEAAEPISWEVSRSRPERMAAEKATSRVLPGKL